jgi:hypothetical protein
MEVLGVVETFIGTVEGKTVQCMRLLKAYTGQEEEEQEAVAEEDEEEDAGGGSNIMAEHCLDRQMLDLILATGGPDRRGLACFAAARAACGSRCRLRQGCWARRSVCRRQ